MRKFCLGFVSVCVLVALFAFGAEPTGQAVASATVNDQVAPTVVTNITATDGGCGGCSTGVYAATSPSGCVTGMCWNMPASSGPALLSELYVRTKFRIEAYNLGAGIAGGPDPHPPRSSLHL